MNSYVFFPYIKTSKHIQIGSIKLQSTKDLSELDDYDRNNIKILTKALFYKNDALIDNMIFCILPIVDEAQQLPDITALENLRNILGYLYSAPRLSFDGIFLSSENTAFIVFAPAKISKFHVIPDHNTIIINSDLENAFKESEIIDGYSGLYNNRSYFWIIPGCRVYPEKQNIVLNISQDLYNDYLQIEQSNRTDILELFSLLSNKTIPEETQSKIFTSLKWYNLATKNPEDKNFSIACLSIAFEALLGLPSDEKTNRIIDSVSLLLGRPTGIKEWFSQFYNIRSAIIHEGETERFYFAVNGTKQKKIYGSFYNHGLKIYQLTLSTFLHGVKISAVNKIEEYFISNQARMEGINKYINEYNKDNFDIDSLRIRIENTIESIIENEYIPENEIQIDLILNVVKNVSKVLLDNGVFIYNANNNHIETFLKVNIKDQKYEALEALKELNDNLGQIQIESLWYNIYKKIIRYAWRHLGMTYIYFKK